MSYKLPRTAIIGGKESEVVQWAAALDSSLGSDEYSRRQHVALILAENMGERVRESLDSDSVMSTLDALASLQFTERDVSTTNSHNARDQAAVITYLAGIADNFGFQLVPTEEPHR